ncbi:MAG: hypothetical protein QME81_04105 [bacterium]|nr:hypothetical protein [bacterium]
MVRKCARQLWNLRMGLRVIPTNGFLASKEHIAVVKYLTIQEIEIFEDAELQPTPKPDTPPDEAGGRAVRVKVER